MLTERMRNEQLLASCQAEPVDLALVEDLLRQGGEPMGVVGEFRSENNLYDAVLDYYLDVDTEEGWDAFADLTALFLQYGMDLQKPDVPYDDADVLHPLWSFAFPGGEGQLRALKLLLDAGLSADCAAKCWGHMLTNWYNSFGELEDEGAVEAFRQDVRKIMLIASYPHVLQADEDLREVIWCSENPFDPCRFRQWEDFDVSVDTRYCQDRPEIYRSMVTLTEKRTGEVVWRMGLGLDPDRLKQTRKLYEEDACMAEFSAMVLSSREENGRWKVVLDQTAFFPEGGGQAPDRGTLDQVNVLDVQLDGDSVVHLCDGPLSVGECVAGRLDWPLRFSRIQQHTGEHIVSGIVHRLFGYDNVGFHMGADCVTVDFSGKLTDEQLETVRQMANRAVWENLPVRTWYPDSDELSSLEYRSKKALTGPVRLVEIEDTDLCACCAPHVERTGAVGPIVFLGREAFHGGTRLEMLCGEAACEYMQGALEQNKAVSALLSAKPLETAAAVRRQADEVGNLKLQLSRAVGELHTALAEAHRGKGNVLLFREGGDAGRLACAVSETCGGKCAVFVKTEGGFRYAVAEQDADLKDFCRMLHEALGGRGGGRGSLVQGSICAGQAEIEAYFARLL